MTDQLLQVNNLEKHFPMPLIDRVRTGARSVRALDGVSFSVKRGETLGVVGESGCGKSTLARTLVGLDEQTGGTIHLEGRDISTLSRGERAKFRSRIQMIFQDPYASLDPRMLVYNIIREGWRANPGLVPRAEQEAAAKSLLDSVRLPAESLSRFPHQFSGGQRQRIGIARALAVEPEILVCDEPTSGLDVSVQAQVLTLLAELKAKRELTVIFITHDLPVIRSIADRVIVMYLGKIVEVGPAERVFSAPQHPYTRALLSAMPDPMRIIEKRKSDRIVLQGDVPSPINPPSGCRFRTRCWKAQGTCAKVEPLLANNVDSAACHFPENVDVALASRAKPL